MVNARRETARAARDSIATGSSRSGCRATSGSSFPCDGRLGQSAAALAIRWPAGRAANGWQSPVDAGPRPAPPPVALLTTADGGAFPSAAAMADQARRGGEAPGDEEKKTFLTEPNLKGCD